MEKLLNELVERMKGAYGGDLVSMILYGSAASGDYSEKHSDLNVLCVLRQVRLAELERGAGTFRWWIKKGQTPPLLFSEEEIRDATDVFPIEFLDIREKYRLLHGPDVVSGIQVNTANHRRQVEHELRSRILRLRKRFLETQQDPKAVIGLMLDSLPTFATLFRHALLLAGRPAPMRKPEIFRVVAEHFGVGPDPFNLLVEVRAGTRQLPSSEVRDRFEAYLGGITRMSEVVDEL